MVEEICAEMALTRPEAFSEYVIFVVTNQGEWLGGLSMRAQSGGPRSDATSSRRPLDAMHKNFSGGQAPPAPDVGLAYQTGSS